MLNRVPNEEIEEKDTSDISSEMGNQTEDPEKGDFSEQHSMKKSATMNSLKYQSKQQTMTSISKPSEREKQLRKEKTLERTYSISGGSVSRPRVPVRQRMAGEFRTLSINLTEGGLNEKGTKKGGKVTRG